jgi:hypothetical protein
MGDLLSVQRTELAPYWTGVAREGTRTRTSLTLAAHILPVFVAVLLPPLLDALAPETSSEPPSSIAATRRS